MTPPPPFPFALPHPQNSPPENYFILGISPLVEVMFPSMEIPQKVPVVKGRNVFLVVVITI